MASANQRVGARITWGEPQQAGAGEKGNAARVRSIKTGDDHRAVPPHGDQLVLGDADACLGRECERQDFARRDVPGVVRLGELGQGEAAIGQADGGLGPRPAQRRAGTEEEAQICGRVGLGVNRIGGAQEGLEAYERREFAGADSQERAGRIEAEAQGPEAGGVIKGQHIVNVPIRFAGQHVLAHGALDQDSAPAIRAAILDGSKQHRAVLGAGLQREGGGINGKGVGPLQPFRRISKRNGRTMLGGVQSPHEPSLSLPLDMDFPAHERARRMRWGRRRSSRLRARSSVAGAARLARRSCN